MLLLHISEENIVLLTPLHLFDSFKAQNTSFFVPPQLSAQAFQKYSSLAI